jgi:hypothetical protein
VSADSSKSEDTARNRRPSSFNKLETPQKEFSAAALIAMAAAFVAGAVALFFLRA